MGDPGAANPDTTMPPTFTTVPSAGETMISPEAGGVAPGIEVGTGVGIGVGMGDGEDVGVGGGEGDRVTVGGSSIVGVGVGANNGRNVALRVGVGRATVGAGEADDVATATAASPFSVKCPTSQMTIIRPSATTASIGT